jgi:DNA helicase II / ATP-dependent DNA helicase PcrA
MTENHQIRQKTNDLFASAYAALNPEQRKAVDLIDGPVLVVAGPGTGKTQILALRIGNILLQTDTQPQNILCLTYTDAGAIAMRKRLLEYIGTDAYKIQVHTFHSFCNQIIQDNQEIFSGYADLMHISELEKARMYRDLIDQLPYDNPLRRLRGSQYYEVQRMDRLFSTIKKEFWTPEMIYDKIEQEINTIERDKTNKDYFYLINSKFNRAGDPKKKYYDVMRNLELLREATRLFQPFQQKMREAGRYDFDDMIHWVVRAFKEDDLLLASYQERFLYLLVDEYQDTNGSQNQIIQLLADYWEKPNLFVVGDEDQAIFRFQGANITNLKELYQEYKPQTIVLKENYRSTQPILDVAINLISNNEERLGNQVPGIDKILRAQPASAQGPLPKVVEYPNTAQEETAVFQALHRLKEEGEALHEIAVIYRRHAQATNLIKALTFHSIPVDVKHRVNILDDPLIINIENMLTFVYQESKNPGAQDHLLFRIMHYRFFNLAPTDLARLAHYCWRDSRAVISLRQTIKDRELLETLNLANVYGILTFCEMIDRWIQRIPHVTLQVFFEYLLKEGNILSDIMSGELRTYRMQVVATFFNYLKAESHRNPAIDLETLLSTISQMRDIGIPLPMQSLIRNKDGINFLTAHGAKGLEFRHVFIIGCNRRNWEKLRGRSQGFTLPSNLQDPSEEADERDERRLFYVAMTRAKENLTMSYAAENLNGMPAEHSQFITECMSGHTEFTEQQTLPQETVEFYQALLDNKDQPLPLLDHELIDKKLERFTLSPTALNRYLECPRSFYFEYILGVPRAGNQYLGFGSAVHEALSVFLNKLKEGLVSTPQTVDDFFEPALRKFQPFFTPKQYENYLVHGREILPKYVADKLMVWQEAEQIITEKSIGQVTHKGVPITGRLDLLMRGKDSRVRVIDFKTGNIDNERIKNAKLKVPANLDEKGGDYWRQVVFYKILLKEAGDPALRLDEGIMSFVEPDKYGSFEDHNFLVSQGEVDKVSQQMVDTYEKIKNHEFDVDCGRPECTWCSFVKNDFVLPPEIIKEEEDADHTTFLFGEDAIQLHFDF